MGAFGNSSPLGPLGAVPKNESQGKTSQLLDFDASRSNPIYGKSPTVQPPSLAFNYIVKY